MAQTLGSMDDTVKLIDAVAPTPNRPRDGVGLGEVVPRERSGVKPDPLGYLGAG